MDTAAAAASPTTNFDVITKITTFDSHEIANCDLNYWVYEVYSDFDMFE